MHKNRYIDHWNRIESPEISPHNYGQLITVGNIQWGKESLFSKWYWEIWTATYKSLKLEYTFTPYTKINSKQLNDLSIRQDTIKLLEEYIGKTFSDINHTNVFSQSHKVIEIKAKINKRYLTKLKSFCRAKENINKTEQQPINCEKIFAHNVTNEDLISKIYKELIKFNNNEKQTTQLNNGQRAQISTFFQRRHTDGQ